MARPLKPGRKNMAPKTIRVMIVDDSPFFRSYLAKILESDRYIQVVAVAGDAFEAQKKLTALKPDVITLDVEMPKMRGTDFLRYITPRYPDTRVVMVSSVSSSVFDSLHAGAFDFVIKPDTLPNHDQEAFRREIIQKVKIAASAPAAPAPPPPKPKHRPAAPSGSVPAKPLLVSPRDLIAIGASTGGTEALLSILRELPAGSPGIAIVQHMPPVFTDMFAQRLDKACPMTVREAKDGDRLHQGLVLVAPGDRHMQVRQDAQGYYVRCEGTEKVNGHCPSVDVLFESVAKCAGHHSLGVILTGMGSDGARQLLAMRRAGAYTIGQDQPSCVVYGMPMAAYNLGAVAKQLPLGEIAPAIISRYSSVQRPRG